MTTLFWPATHAWQPTPGLVGDNGCMTDAQPQPDPSAEPPSRTSTSTSSVTVRRAPRYPRFIILGAGLGAVITFILTALYPVDPNVGFGALFGYFALFGVSAGAALGGGVAVLLDVLATRRAKKFDAEHTTVDALPEDVEGDLED